jgi:LmbE family N-acetylglucosaminyl deacetylase
MKLVPGVVGSKSVEAAVSRKTEAFARGTKLFENQYERPVFLMAHHDDELSQAGLFQRLGPFMQAVWVTNSDGLYFESDLTPPEYGVLRMKEGVASVAMAGIPESATRCYAYSEVEIYRWLSEINSGKTTMQAASAYFDRIRRDVRNAVFELQPDALFTLAWQGGQPEHDLVHFFTMLAVRDFEKETGHLIDFFHMPAYEYTILVAHRFHPLYRGERIRIRLTDAEMDIKLKMVAQYPSQERLFNDFQKVFKLIGKFGYVTGGPRNATEWLGTEEFGPVPRDIDYTKNTHVFDRCTYINDDFEGAPVTFKGSIKPIIEWYLK